MYEFIVTNWKDVLLVIGFLIFMLAIWKRGSRQFFFAIIADLIETAENHVMGDGVAKKTWVIASAYKALPTILKYLYTEKEVSDIVQTIFDFAQERFKKLAEENKNEVS